MKRRLVALVAAVAVAVVVSAGAVGAAEAGRPFATTLTGAAEVPGPGDSDGSGSAAIVLNQGSGTVCFDVSWENVDGTVVASHIHAAPAGVAGGVVVTLFTGAAFGGTGADSGCTTGVDRGLIKAIRQNPSAFYVNVHSTVFPAGAVRGQLSK
ncbi:MAG: CHRD domain-containing protein [Actinomycetota bacterium]